MKDIDRSNDIVLKLEGDRIDSSSFLRCVEDFLGLIKEVQSERMGSKCEVTWLISVEAGSAQIRATPFADIDLMNELTKVKESIDTGVSDIQIRGEQPQYFSEKALERLRGLGTRTKVNSDGIGITGIKINANGRFKPINASAAVNAKNLIKKPHTSYGSISGTLDVIIGRQGLEIKIYNDLKKWAVKCKVDEIHVDKMIAAFRRRVSVYGKITYDNNRKPIKLRVSKFRVLKDNAELPQMYEVLGVLKTD